MVNLSKKAFLINDFLSRYEQWQIVVLLPTVSPTCCAHWWLSPNIFLIVIPVVFDFHCSTNVRGLWFFFFFFSIKEGLYFCFHLYLSHTIVVKGWHCLLAGKQIHTKGWENRKCIFSSSSSSSSCIFEKLIRSALIITVYECGSFDTHNNCAHVYNNFLISNLLSDRLQPLTREWIEH